MEFHSAGSLWRIAPLGWLFTGRLLSSPVARLRNRAQFGGDRKLHPAAGFLGTRDEGRDIDVVINGFYCEYFAAKSNGKQFRSALSARNQNFYIWADSCFGELSGLERTFKDAPPPKSTFLLEDAPVLNRKQLDTIVHRSKLSAMLASMMRQTYRHAVRYVQGDKAKQYRYASVIASVWREWRVLRRLYAMNSPTVKDLLGTDYVFYALQVEPELNFQGYRPNISISYRR